MEASSGSSSSSSSVNNNNKRRKMSHSSGDLGAVNENGECMVTSLLAFIENEKHRRKMEQNDDKIIKSAGVRMLIVCLYYQCVLYKEKGKVKNLDDFFSDFGEMWNSIPKHSRFQGTFKPTKAIVKSTLFSIYDSFSTFCKKLVEHEIYFDEDQNKFYSFGYHRSKVDALPKTREILQLIRADQNPGDIFEEYLIEQFSMLKYLFPRINILQEGQGQKR